MHKHASVLIVAVSLSIFPASLPAASAVEPGDFRCGSGPDRVVTDLFLHRQAAARRAGLAALEPAGPAYLPDVGNIAILDDSEGAVIRPNPFDLNQRTLRFVPAAGSSQYTSSSASLAFDTAASDAGTPLAGLGDDDTRLVRLPFAFPFFGQRYDAVYINSDGNLTFTVSDTASTDRSPGRALSGPPRVFPFFHDLDPSQPNGAVRYFAASDRAVVTWDQVPEWVPRGIGSRQSFQVALYSDGRVEFHYREISVPDAVVGIAPGGGLTSGFTAGDLSAGVSGPASGAIAEIFASTSVGDFTLISQKFYRNHDDVYDYIVLFNNMGTSLESEPSAFAAERNIRNQVRGIGGILMPNPIIDLGADWGSPARLQSFVNMGPLSNYPVNPKDVVLVFTRSRNTTLSILGQESGHRFLAYVRYLDPGTGQPSSALLGRQLAHWNFFFNSDASVMEGNRIDDRGAGQTPRFLTSGTVEHYSAVDQYLMGLRAASDVPNSFLVRDPSIRPPPLQEPQAGLGFDGTRQDIAVQMIIDAEGKRVPDSTVAQKHFSFAFVLLAPAGTQPSAADLAQVEQLRTAWETFFNSGVDNLGAAHTSLVKQLRLSTWPAGGVLRGSPATATVSVAAPLASKLDVLLGADSGVITVPSVVTIPAGSASVSFPITGNRLGVAELVARTADPAYDTSRTFVQVREDPAQLKLDTVSGDGQQGGRGATLLQPIVLRLHDENDVPFSGVAVTFTTSGDGAVNPPRATTDADGRVRVSWRLASNGTTNTLRASLEGAAAVSATASALAVERAVFSAAAVVNAASFNTGLASANTALAPGGLVAIFGGSLASQTQSAQGFPLPVTLGSTKVTMNGVPAPLLYVSPSQINLQVPAELSGPTAEIVVSTVAGPSTSIVLPLGAAQPGIFFDAASGEGAIVQNSDGKLTSQRPARAGDFLQVYATALGAVSPPVLSGLPAPLSILSRTLAQPQITIGGLPATVVFSGLAPGFAGLYQLTIQVPDAVPAGRQGVVLTVSGLRSNEVFVNVGL